MELIPSLTPYTVTACHTCRRTAGVVGRRAGAGARAGHAGAGGARAGRRVAGAAAAAAAPHRRRWPSRVLLQPDLPARDGSTGEGDGTRRDTGEADGTRRDQR